MPALLADKTEPFAASRERFSAMGSYLMSKDARNLTHSELERELEKRGLELMRSLLQAHLDVRGPGEAMGPVEGSDGVAREQERLHERGLETIFGEVQVRRVGYGAEGVDSLHPLDADLNLPPELYSHEVRRRVAEEVAQGSFAATVKQLHNHTGAHVGRRQVEELTARAAQDFDQFYEEREADASREMDGDGSRRLHHRASRAPARRYRECYGSAKRARETEPAAAGEQASLGECAEGARTSDQGSHPGSLAPRSPEEKDLGRTGRRQPEPNRHPAQIVPQIRDYRRRYYCGGFRARGRVRVEGGLCSVRGGKRKGCPVGLEAPARHSTRPLRSRCGWNPSKCHASETQPQSSQGGRQLRQVSTQPQPVFAL